MAAGYIECDHTFPLVRQIVSAVLKARDARAQLAAAVEGIGWGLRDGDGSSAAHYALLAAEGSFVQNGYASANAAAKSLYDEASALLGKLAATGGDATGVAIDKLAGYLGV